MNKPGDQMIIPISALKDLESKSDFVMNNKIIRGKLKSLNLETPKIICLSGYNGAGKDLWASFMKIYEPSIELFHFADRLKEEFKLSGFTCSEIDRLKRLDTKIDAKVLDYDIKDMTMRDALIYVAESNKERFGCDYYSKYTIELADIIFNEKPRTLVFVDLRFYIENISVQELAKDLGLEITYLSIPEDLPTLIPDNY